MEEHFRDTLERAVANEPPVIDQWARFERRVRRDRGVRVFGSMAAIVAVLVAVVIIVPKLGGKPVVFKDPGPTPESPSPSPSPTADQYAGWETFESSAADRFTLRHPSEWRVVRHEGSYEVLAPGQVGTQEGTPTMAVTIELLEGEFDSPELRGQGFDRSTRADGRPFVWTEESIANGGRKHQYRIDWSTCVPGIMRPGCIRTPETLYVTIQADGAQRVESYLAIAEKVVASIANVGAQGPYTFD
jgi:hypothetical protein